MAGSREWTRGALTGAVDSVRRDGLRALAMTLTAVTLVAERQAKINASTGTHRRGEPHVPGTGPGPNRVTGNLVRSITHTPLIISGPDLLRRVGTASTAPYGEWLETGLRNGATYPFLADALRFAARIALPGIALEQFNRAFGRR